jgi:hypothetical protein
VRSSSTTPTPATGPRAIPDGAAGCDPVPAAHFADPRSCAATISTRPPSFAVGAEHMISLATTRSCQSPRPSGTSPRSDPRLPPPVAWRTRGATEAGRNRTEGPRPELRQPAHVRPRGVRRRTLPPYTSLSHATGPARRPVWRGVGSAPVDVVRWRTAQGADEGVDRRGHGSVDFESTLGPPNSPAAPGLSARIRPRLPAPTSVTREGCG